MANPDITVLTGADSEVWMDGQKMTNIFTRVSRSAPFRNRILAFVGNQGTYAARILTDPRLDLDGVWQRNSASMNKLYELAYDHPDHRKKDISAVFGIPQVSVGGYVESACYTLVSPNRDIMTADVDTGNWGFAGAGFEGEGVLVAPTMSSGDKFLEETTASKFLSTNITGRGGNTDSALQTFSKTEPTMLLARFLSRTGTRAAPPTATLSWDGTVSAGTVSVTHNSVTRTFEISGTSSPVEVEFAFRALSWPDGFRLEASLTSTLGRVSAIVIRGNHTGSGTSFTLGNTGPAPFNTGATYTGTGDRLEAQLYTQTATGTSKTLIGEQFHLDLPDAFPLNVFVPVPEGVARAGIRFVTPNLAGGAPAYNYTVTHALGAIG